MIASQIKQAQSVMTDSIKLIAIDLDGTLLNSQHTLTERTEKAIQAARAQGIQIILATGKTRSSALSVIAKLNLDTPGIYVQGLVTHDGDGSIRHQSTLKPEIARQVMTFAEDRGFSLIAYSGTAIYVRQRNKDVDVLLEYGEVEPKVVGPLQNLLGRMAINKIAAIHVADERRVTALRWQLGMQLNGTSRLMQAGVPTMLEVLPPGGSKGAALKVLLKDLNIPTSQVMAIGDGENDIDMIQQARIGVAVGNAGQKVKEAADQVVASNDEDGVAEAIEKFALKPAEPEKPAQSENETKSEVGKESAGEASST